MPVASVYREDKKKLLNILYSRKNSFIFAPH